MAFEICFEPYSGSSVVKYGPGKFFSWFPKEMVNVWRETDKNLLNKQLDNVAKFKGNNFYGKITEDLSRHKRTKFTRDEKIVDNC